MISVYFHFRTEKSEALENFCHTLQLMSTTSEGVKALGNVLLELHTSQCLSISLVLKQY